MKPVLPGPLRLGKPPSDLDETPRPSLKTQIWRLVRMPDNWQDLDDVMYRPITIDFTHRGSTMRITIGPKDNGTATPIPVRPVEKPSGE